MGALNNALTLLRQMMQTSKAYKLLQQLKIIHKVAHLCREAGITYLVGSRSRLQKSPTGPLLKTRVLITGEGTVNIGFSSELERVWQRLNVPGFKRKILFNK